MLISSPDPSLDGMRGDRTAFGVVFRNQAGGSGGISTADGKEHKWPDNEDSQLCSANHHGAQKRVDIAIVAENSRGRTDESEPDGG